MNPDNKDYWYNRAYCYAQVNAYDIAKRQLEYILKRWPNFTSAINLADNTQYGAALQTEERR